MVDPPKDESTEPPPELLKRILRTMDREQFNRFVARLWAEHGWKTTREANGPDIIVGTPGLDEARYEIYTNEYLTKKIDGELVADYAAGHDASEKGTAVIVTTGDFSWDASDRARILNVKLVDGDDLVNRVQSVDAYDIINDCNPVETELDSASKLDQVVSQHERESPRKPGQSMAPEKQPVPPWLTVLPGIELDRDWARRFVLAVIAAVTLISVYNFLPASGPVSLRLARVILYFTTIGAVVSVFIAFYMDMELIRRADVHWKPRPGVYLTLVAFTFGIVWGFYFYKRYYHLGGVLARPPLMSE